MKHKTLPSLLLGAAWLAAGGSASAQQAGIVRVDFLGPGGHSSNNYGRTSALHAAGRTAILIQQALPAGSYVLTDLTGGNSVNSIASDGLVQVRLMANDAAAYQGMVAAVTTAAAAGAKAENDFRNVKPGDLTAGAPADIRYVVTDGGLGARAVRAPMLRRSVAPSKDDHDHLNN